MKRTLMLSLGVVLVAAGCGYDELCWRGNCSTQPQNCNETCNEYGCYMDCGGGYPVSPDAGYYPCEDPYCGNSNGNGGPYPVGDAGVGPGPSYPYCSSDAECYSGEACVDGWCTWQPTEWCESAADCAEGQVCSVGNVCATIVEDCPLTDACLADPEGYTPEWMGIDPYYIGAIEGNGFTGRIDLIVDFYEDHLYGEAQAHVTLVDQGYTEFLDLIVTGSRDGSLLDGQIVERWSDPRRFDATFGGELISASLITTNVTVITDQDCLQFTVQLHRISPCGCVPGQCTADVECDEGQLCVAGACQVPCATNCDCPSGQFCDAGFCALP